MSVNLRWADAEHTLLLYDVQGAWAWSDLYAALLQAHRWLDEEEHVVHSIVDLRGAGRMGENPLRHGRRLASAIHPRTGMTVFVGAPGFMKALFSVLGRLYPQVNYRLQCVDTMEAAYDLLQANVLAAA